MSGTKTGFLGLKRADGYGLALVVVTVAGAYGLGYWRRGAAQPLTPAPAPQDHVGFQPAEIDLGAGLWGEVVPVSLTFSNGGEKPIVVESIKSNCETVKSTGKCPPPGP